ncbi:MAG: Cu(I)-responsive transcriptional regulator [Planctomycetales bacterium]|nr:Cu(I)-responsive transcriptional regulator [Planctomycetales bacterium]MCC0025195.1 Cu(I)-responsive transcriptional regulator [Hyphomicrobiaceae bacterium]
MNIGTASDHSGLPPKTIRYYEEIGLIKADRAPNGYRDYSETHLHKLAFLHRARGLGFSIEECRQLLALYEDKSRASGDVKELAEQKLVEIDRKMLELRELKKSLGHLVEHCHGDDRPDCPILDSLAEGLAPQ